MLEKRNMKKALEYYNWAADNGDVMALNELGIINQDSCYFSAAKEYFRQFAAGGNKDAQLNYANLLEIDLRFIRDDNKRQLLERKVEALRAMAKSNIGLDFEKMAMSQLDFCHNIEVDYIR